jgi:GNAT superfamily N-acetyltransferase
MMATPLRIVEADLSQPQHQRDVLALTDAIAEDPVGNAAPLPETVRARLIDGLRRHPTTLIFLAYDGDTAVGIATCFVGFSTFYAQPLINIHDLLVLPSARGRGVAGLLLDAVETRARALDCCKLTLEVQEQNDRARTLYAARGFGPALYGDPAAPVLFYAKRL